jgi:formate dehydrogenase alpha subunit
MQRFARAVIGTNNIDHCARLCHAPTVAGLAAAFGSGAMTNPMSDIGKADVILVTGSNTTHAHPVLALEIIGAVKNGAKLIVIEPRRIDLVDQATLWLSQKPGTDAAVLNGLMNAIISQGLTDQKFIRENTEGFRSVETLVKKYTPEVVEKIAGVPAEKIREAARLYGKAKRGSIIFSMGITQHTTGVDNVLSIANLAMMTGNIGRPGTGVNPLRGQNNVQGACDMGALPNVLPGYQQVTDDGARKGFESAWSKKLPTKSGLTVVEMFNAACQGKLKAMYIMGENPMLSDPDISHVEEGLKNLNFLVVQDIFLSETARLADVVLPGASFAEKSGTFTNTERRVQPVREAIKPIGESLPDWKIIGMVSKAMDYKMDYTSPGEITDEIALVTPQYGGILHRRVQVCGIHWPCPTPDHVGTPILHKGGKFARGKGKFHPVEFKPPAEVPDKEYPLYLTTGRYLYQYHTGTMTRRVKGLEETAPIGWAEVNPADAEKYKISDGALVTVATRRGKIKTKAKVSEVSPPGTIFLSFHYAEAPANRLTNPALDPIAKIAELKVSACRIHPA